MHKVVAWLGAATLLVLAASASASGPTVLKPYVVLILDTSGSMIDTTQGNPTGSGPPSCLGPGGTALTDNKLNHAKCAIQNIANSYGDMVLALGRFRNESSGTVTGTFPAGCCQQGPDVGAGGGCPAGPRCTANDDMFEMLAPLVDGQNSTDASWVNFSGNTCTASGTDPEIWNANSNTPLGGVLLGARDYWQGNQANTYAIAASPGGATEAGTTATFTVNNNFVQGEQVVVAGVGVAGYNGTWTVATATTTNFTATLSATGLASSGGGTARAVIWPAGAAGYDPINTDPVNSAFLPQGCDPSSSCTGANCCNTQCRPYIVILLTDGVETCGGSATAAATAMLTLTPHNDAIAISTITRATNTVTVTTAINHTFSVGQSVVVAGVTNASFNGTFTIATVPAANKITYTQNGANGSSSGGTAAHVSSQDMYRVLTKPIGLGVTPGDATIEGIAHAGGAPDVPNVNEGFYASDQAGLELAISQIIEGSVRSEVCNNLDDDCDGAIDEDFPNKGQACDDGKLGVCKGTGTLVCRADGTGLVCDITNPGGSGQTTCPPNQTCNGDGTETCGNGLDDDCDGKVDEGCTACVPTGEICNNKDDDCDGIVDEDITRQCGTGACLGTETCVNGVFVGCTAQMPTTEICNGLDDDCDGIADGFTLACSNMVTPGGPASDNPGDPSNNPIPQNICHPGSKTCPVAPPGNGTFSACVGEQTPEPEICNGLDDDCDNQIDEDFVPQPCSTNCGVGMTQCIGGTITCNAQPATGDATCNNVDDDCDGQVDEDWMCNDPNSIPNSPCACGAGVVCNGVAKCINGTVQCVGDPINVETCNCKDDDCDGTIDEGTTCPGGATCTDCQCAFPCSSGEFPCPEGKKCNAQNFCVNDPCFGQSCPAQQVCIDNMNNPLCVSDCDPRVITCPTTQVCTPSDGQCHPNDCTTFPNLCAPNQNCVVNANGMGQCLTNYCQGVTCQAGQYCVAFGHCSLTTATQCFADSECPNGETCGLAGNCVGSCVGVDCPTGQRCELGACVTDPCGHPCPGGQVCDDTTGECIANPCTGLQCPQGQYCDPNNHGQCEPDPCIGTMCPSPDQVCKGGSCYDPSQFLPDAGVETHVTVGGGGCDAGGGHAGLLIGLALLAARRRRRS